MDVRTASGSDRIKVKALNDDKFSTAESVRTPRAVATGSTMHLGMIETQILVYLRHADDPVATARGSDTNISFNEGDREHEYTKHFYENNYGTTLRTCVHVFSLDYLSAASRSPGNNYELDN